MAQLTKANITTKYNDASTGLFKDNSAGDIGADDARAMVADFKDSALFLEDNFIDEDDMASDSATKVPSQQSVKAYVDAAALGIVTSWKAPVVNATTANITLSGEQTIDGVLTSASRILVKNQSSQSENGIYVTAAGAWARSSDANAAAELEGAAVTVQQGSTNANTTWIQTTDGITLGSSNIVWAQLGTAPSSASESAAGIAELATQAETNTGTDDARIVTPLKLHTKVVGVQDLFIPASAMWPRVTNGCSPLSQTEVATSLFNIQTLDFNQTIQQFAQFQIVPPRKWNNETVTFVPYWTATSGSGTVQWGLSLGAYSNDDPLTTALGTAQTSDDTLIATTDMHAGPESAAITVAGTPADADLLAVQISRNPASDTLNSDAKLLGISIRFTCDAAKDN